MRQRREIPIHIFELAYATVRYEPIFQMPDVAIIALVQHVQHCNLRHHASTFVAAVATRSHNTIAYYVVLTFYHL